MPSAVYRPSTDTGSLPATHTLLSWQTSKEKLWLRVYTSCLSILLCFSKNLANQQARRMLPSAKLLLSARYTENAWITMCRYLDDLWGKQTFQDTLESLFVSKLKKHVENIPFFSPGYLFYSRQRFTQRNVQLQRKRFQVFSCTSVGQPQPGTQPLSD